MTQSSPARTSRGINRPVLALAFGTAAAATVLAPVASMAAAAPTYNDFGKAAGTIKAPAKIGGATAALQTKRATALPATAFPVPVTGTAYGDAQSQALTASAGAKKTAVTTAYNAWKTAATPVVNAWIAYTKAAPAKKAAALKVYNAKLAVYNKKVAGALTNGAAKWTAYSTAYNAWLPVYNAQLTAVKNNHFKLAAKTTFSASCTADDNRTAAQLGARSGVENGPVGSPGAGFAIFCDTGTGTLSYYLPDAGHGTGGGWETFTENITTNPATGAVTGLNYVTDATGSSLETYIKSFIHTPITSWLATHPLTATTKADFAKFGTKALNESGALTGTAVVGGTGTCIAVSSGATLTCQAFTESLQRALNASVTGMPY